MQGDDWDAAVLQEDEAGATPPAAGTALVLSRDAAEHPANPGHGPPSSLAPANFTHPGAHKIPSVHPAMLQQDGGGTGRCPPPCPHRSGDSPRTLAAQCAWLHSLKGPFSPTDAGHGWFCPVTAGPPHWARIQACTQAGSAAGKSRRNAGCGQCRSISPRQGTPGNPPPLLGRLFGCCQALCPIPNRMMGLPTPKLHSRVGAKPPSPSQPAWGFLLPQTHLQHLGPPGKVQNQLWQHIKPAGCGTKTIFLTLRLRCLGLSCKMLTARVFQRGAG